MGQNDAVLFEGLSVGWTHENRGGAGSSVLVRRMKDKSRKKEKSEAEKAASASSAFGRWRNFCPHVDGSIQYQIT